MSLKFLLVLLYLLLGVYFINFSFGFVQIPAVLTGFNNWIITIGGLLMVYAGITHLTSGKSKKLLSAE